MIGPGGENLVRYACVMNGLKDAAGRTGMGAVMGSKKLKAVVPAGRRTWRAPIPTRSTRWPAGRRKRSATGNGLLGCTSRAPAAGRWKAGSSLATCPSATFAMASSPRSAASSIMMDKIGVGMEGCWACAVRCKKVVQAEEPFKVDPDYGGPEYETIGSLGSTCGVSDIVAVSRANELCNAHSLDTIGAGVTIAFAMECFEEGLLTREDTGGIELRFGNGEAMVQMVEKIARREGLGDMLAEGLLPAAAKIGEGAERFAVHAKGQAQPMHEPRLKRGLAIGYAVSPTGADHCHSLHDTGLAIPDEDGFLFREGLRAMGVLEAMDLESLGPEKVRATIYNSMTSIMHNCLTMCIFPAGACAS